MNVLTTFRQANGLSATLLNQPLLTGPFTLPAATATANSFGGTEATGPSGSEVAGTAAGCTTPCITGSPQQAPGTAAGAIPKTTFGESGGIFATGFGPFNANTSGLPYGGFTPYAIPYYAGTSGDATIVPLGGPPAYDPSGVGKGTRTGHFSASIRGVDMGIAVFAAVTPGAGTYNLTAQIPTTGGTTSIPSTATLGAGGALPATAAATVTYPGDGTAVIAYTLPAGVVGAFVQVADRGAYDGSTAPPTAIGGNCNGEPVYYTFWVTAAAGTVTIANANAPEGTPVAVCSAAQNAAATGTATATGDRLDVDVIGFDYNHYALTDNGALNATYPQSPAMPVSADMSLSPLSSTYAP